MKYLGKRYLHKFLKAQGFNPPALKEMEYKVYRGDEFLESSELRLFMVRGKSIYLGVNEYDEERDKYIEVSRYTYLLTENGEWKKGYERIGVKRKSCGISTAK